MPQPSRPALPAILAVGAFGALSLLGAWFILIQGGFSHMPYRTSRDVTFVAGGPARLMAVVQLLAATLAITWLLRLKFAMVPSMVMALALAFGPAAIFWLGRGA